MNIFTQQISNNFRANILVSFPHSGTALPDHIRSQMTPAGQSTPDTDWYLDQLYEYNQLEFVNAIKANFSRYVVDLNRSPEDQPLYTDGRKLTGVVPLETFNGESIYITPPNFEDTSKRIEEFHTPYHAEIRKILDSMHQQKRNILLFDAHSIPRHVPSISESPFPDLILGNNNGASCDELIIDSAYIFLSNLGYKVTKNVPFSGGHITRSFGSPSSGIHSLQLEMSQDLYMDVPNKQLDHNKSLVMQKHLSELLTILSQQLREIN